MNDFFQNAPENKSIIDIAAHVVELDKLFVSESDLLKKMTDELHSADTQIIAFGRECHALLCYDARCAGFSNQEVAKAWTEFGETLLHSAARGSAERPDTMRLLRLLATVRSCPFLRQVASFRESADASITKGVFKQ